MDSAGYQSIFNTLVGQGYHLAHVDGYNVAGTPQFAAIWIQSASLPWIAHHDMTSGQFQKTFDELNAQGYRLKKVSGYEGGGQALYAGLWLKTGGPAWQARSGMSSDDYQQTFNQLTGQGYRLTWVDGYAVAGQPTFAAIFEQIGGAPYLARHGLNAAQYQQQFDQAVAQGYRLRHVCGYSVANTPYFAAIWDQVGGVAWQARHNLDPGQFQQTFNSLTQSGMRLTDISGYGVGGGALYAGLWVAD